MNKNKEEVYERVYYELYKAKDSYGVDVLTEIYNYLTKVIEKKLKKTNIMTNQDAKWYKNCNLAIYKECFGITPLGKFSDMETADQKQIPIDKYLGAFYYGYIFIVPKENIEKNISSPYSGDYKKYDKFMLTIRNGDFVLEKFNEENISGDKMVENEKKKLLEKENTELLEKKKRLESEKAKKTQATVIKNDEAELKKLKTKLKKLEAELAKLKKDSKETNKKKELEEELETKIKELETKIKELEKKLKKDKLNKATFDEKSEIEKIIEQIEKNKRELEKNKRELEIGENNENTNYGNDNTDGGFLIEEKDIGGEIYLTFSVSEYLDKMAKPTDKKNEAPPAVIKIVQQPTSVTTLTKIYQ